MKISIRAPAPPDPISADKYNAAEPRAKSAAGIPAGRVIYRLLFISPRPGRDLSSRLQLVSARFKRTAETRLSGIAPGPRCARVQMLLGLRLFNAVPAGREMPRREGTAMDLESVGVSCLG